MEITAHTRVRDLVRTHPYLVDYLRAYDPAFEKLASPAALATVGRVATLATAAETAGVPLDRLIEDLRAAVSRQEGPQGVVEPVGGERREDVLAGIIRQLHDGVPVDQVKRRFAELVSEVDSSDIAAMEQALIAEGMPVEEVQRLCDVHVSVFREALDTTTAPGAPSGHPFDTYLRENEVLGGILNELRCMLDELSGPAPADRQQGLLNQIRAELVRLAEVDVHYLRKENQLFPMLEAHGVAGPTKVMWGLDDEIRVRVRQARADADQGELDKLAEELPQTLGMIEDMVYKEEKILLPVAMESLSAEEWAEMAAGEGAIGFAWIQPPAPYRGPLEAGGGPVPPEVQTPAGEELLPLTTGALSPSEVDLIMRNLPVDVTYVDETGRVRYYSEGDRVFPRSPAVIGREVRNCHPPKSVAVVERIVEEFRAGAKDAAEFWIELDGRFVWIRYLALREEGGAFRGVLEVTQDATHVRGLSGQRRLLDWD